MALARGSRPHVDEKRFHVVLVSTYELGRQPFGLASPAAWLRESGVDVTCLDLAVEELDPAVVRSADVIAFYLPMHTATRLALRRLDEIRRLNAHARLFFYGLYAPVNEPLLRSVGADAVLGGEFEEGLVALVTAEAAARGSEAAEGLPLVSLAKQKFRVPDRSGLPSLDRYAQVVLGDDATRMVGYTEATRGCKHLCRHCPVVPVYGGRFRVVQRDVVLADIAQQVEAGAEHITFGDPDFFNGPGHAVAIVEALHEQFPNLSYDVTIKVEHLLKHARHLPVLRDTGCLFVTSAVESVDERVLEIFDKRHTRDDFVEVVRLLREAELGFNPTFVTFTPWTTMRSYRDLLELIAELELVDNVAPIQYAIRLLIPEGSRLLELAEVQALVDPFDAENLVYPWKHPDPAMDALYEAVMKVVQQSVAHSPGRREVFAEVWSLANDAAIASLLNRPLVTPDPAHRNGRDRVADRAPVPYLTEPWYC